MSNEILSIEKLTKRYGDLEILKNINLDLKKGQTKVLMGPSGTGKSTLLRCINLLDPPTSGVIRLNGENIAAAGVDVDRVRGSVGMVFQDFNLFIHLSVLDNIRLGLVKVKSMNKKEATERACAELEKVGMLGKADSYPAQLSGGQQQRVSIARALALSPDLILFDEPTSALDPELTEEVLGVMGDLAKDGMTMLIASHEVHFARAVADEIVFMEAGLVVEAGAPTEILDHPQNDRTRAFFSRNNK